MLGSPRHDPRVSTLLDQLQIRYEIDPDGDFKLVFDLGNGRSQVAFVNSSTERFGGFEIRETWSIAHISDGPLDADLANELLQRSRRLKFGGWGVDLRGDRHHIIFTVHLSADSDAAALMQALEITLSMSDELERELTGDHDAL